MPIARKGRYKVAVFVRACISIFLRLAICLAILGSFTLEVTAQKRREPELPAAPPPVIPQSVTVRPGESVEIPLGVFGRRTEQLEFLIRTKPRFGSLSKVTSTSGSTASVVYTAPLNPAAPEVRFTYAVRSREGVSAPASVVVTIATPPTRPPRIDSMDAVVFPAVPMGQKATATLEVRNTGGGLLTGDISVNAPFSIEGAPNYRIGAGASATFRLAFRPENPGKVTGQLELGPEPRKVIVLHAEVEEPLTITPERLRLDATKVGKTRMAKLMIRNRTAELITVACAANPRLLTEQSLEVPPNEEVALPVIADAGFADSFEEKLTLSTTGWKKEVVIEVPALQPVLKLAPTPEGRLKFTAAERPEISVVVENVGGKAASAHLSVNPPFTVPQPTVSVAPAEKKSVQVAAAPLSPGKHTVTVAASAGDLREQTTFLLEIEPAPAAPSNPASAMAAKPSLTSPSLVATPAVAAPIAERETRKPTFPAASGREDFPNALGDFAREVTPKSATLEWPTKLGGTEQLAVEANRMALTPEGNLQVTWYALPGVSFQKGDPNTRATLKQLQPETIYTVRVRSGEDTVFTARFKTPKETPLIAISWQSALLTALGVAAVAMLWYRWKHQPRTGL